VQLHTCPQPIRLGASQLAVLLCGLLALAAIAWTVDPYDWKNLYHRDVVIPGMQASHGFTWGAVSFQCRALGSQTYQGVTSVVAGGRFSRLGIRAGDVPSLRHGGGYTALHWAVEAAERGDLLGHHRRERAGLLRRKVGFSKRCVVPRDT
jgi:hypothetical protein